MDHNLETLFPINMNLAIQAHQRYNPRVQSGAAAVYFWPQLRTGDQQSANVSHVEHPSFKRPRTSRATMDAKMPGLWRGTGQCLQHQRGHCNYGKDCRFVHGIGDTRKLLPHRQELRDKEDNMVKNRDEDHRTTTSMKLCKWLGNGKECPHGERCSYVHEGLAKFRWNNYATSIGSDEPEGFSGNGRDQLESKRSVSSSLNANRVSQSSPLWKTRLCNKWEARGDCQFGLNCYFAHGHAELRQLRYQNARDYGNVFTPNMIPKADTRAPLCSTWNATACEQQMQGTKGVFKWKEFKNINGIYADWIEDLPRA